MAAQLNAKRAQIPANVSRLPYLIEKDAAKALTHYWEGHLYKHRHVQQVNK